MWANINYIAFAIRCLRKNDSKFSFSIVKCLLKVATKFGRLQIHYFVLIHLPVKINLEFMLTSRFIKLINWTSLLVTFTISRYNCHRFKSVVNWHKLKINKKEVRKSNENKKLEEVYSYNVLLSLFFSKRSRGMTMCLVQVLAVKTYGHEHKVLFTKNIEHINNI